MNIYSSLIVSALFFSTFLFQSQDKKEEIEVPVSRKNEKTPVVIKLPDGFKSTVFATGLGKARHIASTPQGLLYVKLDKIKKGESGIIVLEDKNKDGKAEVKSKFGDYGGTGITVNDHFLFASSNEAVFKYKLDDNGVVTNPNVPERIVTGLLNKRQHESKSIATDNNNNIYVNIGAPSNCCQELDRTPKSKGMMPCPILDSAGGIWKFKMDKKDQSYGNGTRYATGLRNVVGLDWNQQVNQLFVMQHGRDHLFDFYPEIYDQKTALELPSEAMYALNEGDNAGWPYIYYDHIQKKKIICPEYGGDGKKEGDPAIKDPVIGFPGHLAPNALLFYRGDQFPPKYKNGAFIAFHGSWNRSPEHQKGYFVAFVPFKDGKPSGDWEIFADNFAGVENVVSPGDAKHRPCGLAEGPDGSLYISDDVNGTIFNITYKK